MRSELNRKGGETGRKEEKEDGGRKTCGEVCVGGGAGDARRIGFLPITTWLARQKYGEILYSLA
jgi:hypothetical protein